MKNIFSFIVLTAFVATTYAQEFSHPAFLQPGDTVAFISPSYTGSNSSIESAEAVLRSWGYVPLRSPNLNRTYKSKLAGTTAQRQADLLWALENPAIKAIICSRGGYGSIHLLNDNVPLSTYAEHPKWIIGYSDITSLLNAEAAAGLMSIHGAMGITFPTHGNDTICTFVHDILRGENLTYHISRHGQNVNGTATGRLIGGNLCTFYPLVGTDYDPTLYSDEPFILFMEEVGENFHTIDRMFNMLRLHGLLDKVAGVILGDWASCSADLSYTNVDNMFREYLRPGVPLCCGFPAGHGANNLPLVMGANVTMRVDSNGSTIAFDMADQPQESAIAEIIATEPMQVFDIMGRLVGNNYPTTPGTYVIKQGQKSVITYVSE